MEGLTPVGDMVFFVIGSDLWKRMGTPSGTSLVKHFEPDPRGFPFGYFLSLNGASSFFEPFIGEDGQGLWKSDGTPAGTQLVVPSWPSTSLLANLS